MGGRHMKISESSQWTAANIVTCIRVLFVPIWLMAAEGAATSAVTGSFSPWAPQTTMG